MFKVGIVQKDFNKEKNTDLLILFRNSEILDKKLIKEISLEDNEKLENFNGKWGEILVLPTFNKLSAKRLLIVGTKQDKEIAPNINEIRKLYASIARKANCLKSKNIICELLLSHENTKLPKLCRYIIEVFGLAPYKFDKYISVKDQDEKFAGFENIKFILPEKCKEEKQIKDEMEKALIAIEAVSLARELIAEPPNIATPEYLAHVSEQIIKNNPKSCLSLKVLNQKDCEKLKMGAFLAVGSGSCNEPKFLHFHYKPKSKAKKHIAFVGKGITFDSGGLSLKPAKSMEKMKYDMAGSAAVIGLMSAIAKMDLPLEITGVVAACENMPSGSAYRPGDILTSMSGKTIEISNTDAEGRVTLADSVYYACQKKPDYLFDIATLTGAIVVALGESAAGLMTNNSEFANLVKTSFEEAGEFVWEMPMYEDYEDGVLKGTAADMLNAGSGGQAGSQNGAVFIKQFVGDTPWVHLDIAGTCWPEKRDTHFTNKNNPAGFGVLGFLKFLENIVAN